jgi:hypothetical protein
MIYHTSRKRQEPRRTSFPFANWRRLLESLCSVNFWSTNGASNQPQEYNQICTVELGLFGTDKELMYIVPPLPRVCCSLLPPPCGTKTNDLFSTSIVQTGLVHIFRSMQSFGSPSRSHVTLLTWNANLQKHLESLDF